MKKGSSILVEGRMQTRSWEDKTSGEKKISYRNSSGSHSIWSKSAGASASVQSAEPTKASGGKGPEEIDTIEYPEEDINPEDIPFNKSLSWG